MTDIKSMTQQELSQFLKELGEPAFRAKQVFTWLHRGAASFDEMTNLSKSLREKLKETCFITAPVVARKQESRLDGTIKYLWELSDGNCIETVLMQYHHGNTVCISSQVGCRMGCAFCASTIAGKVRDLRPSEMLDQVMFTQLDSGRTVSNIVLMGIGEPLDNMANVLRFLELVNHPDGMNIGMRHISLSTCGVVPGIDALAEQQLQLTLSVSLHAPDSETRSRIMPVNRAYDVELLFDACHRYFEKTGRRISFEYAMIDGVNDNDWQADLIAKKLRGMPGHVNHPAERRGGEPVQAQPPRGRLPEAAGVPRHHRHGAAQSGRRHRCLLRPAAAKGHGGKGKGAPDMKMWGITNTGLVRSENQDAYAAFTVGGYSVAVVCDGMGGTNGGRVASGIAVEQFEKELRAVLQEDAGEEQLRQATLYAISLANDAIRRAAAQNADYQHMGTTLVCALAKEDLVMVGNIGDSRAYHINGEGIRQISRDHSVVESMVEKGDITPQEARRHPNRNLITRALGPDIQAQADTFAVAWHPGDFILLCTDGLVNTVSDQEMLFEVLHDGDIESCLDHLMQISLRRGAPDNVTVVLLMNT